MLIAQPFFPFPTDYSITQMTESASEQELLNEKEKIEAFVAKFVEQTNSLPKETRHARIQQVKIDAQNICVLLDQLMKTGITSKRLKEVSEDCLKKLEVSMHAFSLQVHTAKREKEVTQKALQAIEQDLQDLSLSSLPEVPKPFSSKPLWQKLSAKKQTPPNSATTKTTKYTPNSFLTFPPGEALGWCLQRELKDPYYHEKMIIHLIAGEFANQFLNFGEIREGIAQSLLSINQKLQLSPHSLVAMAINIEHALFNCRDDGPSIKEFKIPNPAPSNRNKTPSETVQKDGTQELQKKKNEFQKLQDDLIEENLSVQGVKMPKIFKGIFSAIQEESTEQNPIRNKVLSAGIYAATGKFIAVPAFTVVMREPIREAEVRLQQFLDETSPSDYELPLSMSGDFLNLYEGAIVAKAFLKMVQMPDTIYKVMHDSFKELGMKVGDVIGMTDQGFADFAQRREDL